MSSANAKAAAAEWIAQAGLPPDLAGSTIQLADFASDQDITYFYPRRRVAWQRDVHKYIGRALRPRGAKLTRVLLTPALYHLWLDIEQLRDTPALRRTWADSHQSLL